MVLKMYKQLVKYMEMQVERTKDFLPFCIGKKTSTIKNLKSCKTCLSTSDTNLPIFIFSQVHKFISKKVCASSASPLNDFLWLDQII